MRHLKFTLCAFLFVIGSSSLSLAEDNYDAWNCRERDALKAAGLQCLSCGIQQFYSDKGQADVVPSEKWLAFLAVNARAFRQLGAERPPQGPGKPGTPGPRPSRNSGDNSQELDNMKIVMIKQLQAYGFCTRFISKDTLKVTGGKNYRDLSADDWRFLRNLISRETNETEVNNAAKFFGFKQPSFLGIESGKVAMQSMRDLIDDSELNEFSSSNKRSEFKEKLKKILTSEYDVSGERTHNNQVLASDDKDQGMRKCLEEVQQRLKSPEFSDDNKAMCTSMANACGIGLGVCSEPKSSGARPPVEVGDGPSKGAGRKGLPSPPTSDKKYEGLQ